MADTIEPKPKPTDTVTVVPLSGETEEQRMEEYQLGIRAIRDVSLHQLAGHPTLGLLRDAYATLIVTSQMILENLPEHMRRARFEEMVTDHTPHLAEFGYEAKIDDDMLIIGPKFDQ